MKQGFLSLVGLFTLCLASMETQASPRSVHSARSGPWSAPTTWQGGKAPTTGDQVLIREGHVVVYDVRSDNVIRSVDISGSLTFANDKSTLLNVGLIRIAPGNKIIEEGFECDHVPDAKKRKGIAKESGQPGFSAICACCDNKAALLIGTPEKPIDSTCTAIIRLHYVKGMNKESCSAIVCCGGRMDLHGAPMNRTWVKLGDSAWQDDSTVVLNEKVTGWNVGDRIIITGSYGNFGAQRAQTEERTITAINGTRLKLDKSLHYDHRGTGEMRAEVANLSRNVIIESADPDGIRGHTMYHVGSAGSMSYVELRHLGKRGVLGRYPIHYHLCRDTMRGSSVIGVSVHDSDNRWLTIHGTEYLIVRDCVGYQSIGHGFFLEDGTETWNVLDRNLAVQAHQGDPLKGQLLPFDKNDGAGFWWANSHNTFTRNIAADCSGYGFRYEATPRAGFKDRDKSFGEPRRRFSLTMSVLQPNGKREKVDIRKLPFVRFDDNTAHNIGNYALNLGQDAGGVGPDRDHPFVVRNMTIWNAQRAYTVHVPHVKIDGMHIHRCGYEIYRARYVGQDYSNVRLSGIRGKYTVSNLKEYLTSGEAVGESGVGLNRSRLPGFPRGTGAGGTSYQGSKVEVATLKPVDDLPPMTVITQVRKDGNRLIVRGTTSDNGKVTSVIVNNTKARALSDNFAEWEVTFKNPSTGTVDLTAHGEDAVGNVEKLSHRMTIVLR